MLYQREAHPNQMDFQEIDQPVEMAERQELALTLPKRAGAWSGPSFWIRWTTG